MSHQRPQYSNMERQRSAHLFPVADRSNSSPGSSEIFPLDRLPRTELASRNFPGMSGPGQAPFPELGAGDFQAFASSQPSSYAAQNGPQLSGDVLVANFIKDPDAPWVPGAVRRSGPQTSASPSGVGFRNGDVGQTTSFPGFRVQRPLSDSGTAPTAPDDSGYGSFRGHSVGHPSVCGDSERNAQFTEVPYLAGLSANVPPPRPNEIGVPRSVWTWGRPASSQPPSGRINPDNGNSTIDGGYSASVSSITSAKRNDLVCETCHQTVKTKCELTKHRQRHTKPNRCDVPGCPRQDGFSTFNDLVRHKRSCHSAEGCGNFFVCNVDGCKKKGKRWPRSDNFRQHLRRVHKLDTNDESNDLERFVVKVDEPPNLPNPQDRQDHQNSRSKADPENQRGPRIPQNPDLAGMGSSVEYYDPDIMQHGAWIVETNQNLQALPESGPEAEVTISPLDAHSPYRSSFEFANSTFNLLQPPARPASGDPYPRQVTSPQLRLPLEPLNRPERSEKTSEARSQTASQAPSQAAPKAAPLVVPRVVISPVEMAPPRLSPQKSPVKSHVRDRRQPLPKVLPQPTAESSGRLPDLAPSKVKAHSSVASTSRENPEVPDTRMKEPEDEAVDLSVEDKSSPPTVDSGAEPDTDPSPPGGPAAKTSSGPEPAPSRPDAGEPMISLPPDDVKSPLPQGVTELVDLAEATRIIKLLQDRGLFDKALNQLAHGDSKVSATGPRRPLTATAHGQEGEDPSDNRPRCENCNKRFKRQSELKKHSKRHEKPYGCTFRGCFKKFGSKNDWKRHESGQHFQMELWKCTEPKAGAASGTELCAKVYHRRDGFKGHLEKDHGIVDANAIEDRWERCRVGRNCESRFWCGFCDAVIDVKKGGHANAARFDHIDNHFIGRQMPKMDMSQWKDIDPEYSSSGSDSSRSSREGSPAEDNKDNVITSQQSTLKHGAAEALEPSHIKRPRVDDRETFWSCCQCPNTFWRIDQDVCTGEGCSHKQCVNCRYERAKVLAERKLGLA